MIVLRKLYTSIVMLVVCYGTCAAQTKGFDPLRYHSHKGYELYEAGKYRSAQEELLKAREHVNSDGLSEAMRIDYYIAECAARTGDRNAMELLNSYLLDYPNSAYSNDIHFAIANLFYLEGNYDQARSEYLTVSPFELRTSQQDEYNFKLGHSFFVYDDYNNASNYFRLVGNDGEYSVHSQYYRAYIDYVNGNYSAAKREFLQLANDPSYGKVIPFYLLQIEFLEGNYDYVLQYGAPLLASATGERVSEIARIMGEAWFHKEDYERTLDYMYRYRDAGGRMGRSENYLVGYSLYMRNDARDAEDYLAQVVGPDDQLTQNAAYHLGGIYLRMGDKRRAMQSFSMASGVDFDPVIKEDALFNYGKLQYELGGGVFNEAINILSRYIEEYPNSRRIDEAREFLIAAYYNSRNYEAAYEAIRMIPNPDNNLKTAFQKISYFRALEYYNEGDFDTAYAMLEESLRNKFNPKYTALTQFWKGEILYRRGQYSQAIPLFREYISLSPVTEREYKMAQYNLGYSYFNQKQYGEARTWFDRFLSNYKTADSYRADVLNRVGDIQYSSREFSNAIASYEAAAAIGTNERYYSRFRRAVAFGLTGSNTRKIDALRDIISAGQGDYVDDAIYELGTTYISMDRFSDGAATLKRLIDEYPNSEFYLEALSDLGLAYQNMNDNNTALRYYKMLVDRAPNSKQARDAMLAVKSIYIDMNDVDGYFAFAGRSGVETDMGTLTRDSLSFVAAERVYMTSSDRSRVISSLQEYLDKFPRGAYRANALYNISETYLADGQTERAISVLKELGDMHYNSFTVRGLEKLGQLSYNNRRYADAADAYRKLATVAVNPETAGNGWSGYLRSARAEGDGALIMNAANEILSAPGVPVNVIRDAKFSKAELLRQNGDDSGALILYKELATESQTTEGAQSTYYVIEAAYEDGNINEAEKMVLDLAKQNTPHSYWLGRAFLILGDIYAQKGDNFQARATLQSIVDGYSPSDDGIIEAARERISKLGD